MTEDQRTKEPKNMQQENDKYVVISTKVSPDTAEQLNAILITSSNGSCKCWCAWRVQTTS